jgi:hypothetical protein
MNKYNLHSTIPAAIFIAIEGLYAVNVMAGEGVVVMTRDVPARPAHREGSVGRATVMDVSPDDKVKHAMSGNKSITNTTELADTEFSKISTETPHVQMALTPPTTKDIGTLNSDSNNNILNVVGSSAGSVNVLSQGHTGNLGLEVGAATGQMANSISLATGSLGGLVGVLPRMSGQ